ncbi:GTPase [Flavobacterium gelidilacus]|uniref:TRAFAC clade GTPase domain-containing protein n=1 Tax=Flavobacterium gelidilacus TaxID=206041 RepID=UPI000422BD1E|nr:GTPase [Flavobacterium gelidilacus]
MTEIKKNNILINCNTIPVKNILDIIKNGEITLDEFITAGLSQETIKDVVLMQAKVKTETKTQEDIEALEKQKQINIDKIIKGKIFAEEIKGLINKKAITFDDISDAGVAPKIVNALKYYCSAEKITRSYSVEDLPSMEEGRTDVYFVGLKGSGKSTMIAGLLNIAHSTGVLLPDSYHAAGLTFQTNLIQDLTRGVLPLATPSGSYNYIAASLNDANNKRHPLNIVDVPGELYNSIQDNAEVSKFLKYINNNNKKILIFVIDSLEHENSSSNNTYDQSVVFPNILQIFNANGVLAKTDAIYLVVNKFDAIKDSKYAYDDRPNGDLALDFLNQDFLSLKNNCLAAREDNKNSIKIKVMPFSIGSISYGSILNTLEKDFAKTIVNQITKDSFVIRGGAGKVFN